MKKKDISTCYKTLRVTEGSSLPEVKRSFHLLAARYHPDANLRDRQAAEKFKHITRAYETLKDHLRKRDNSALPEPARPKDLRVASRRPEETFIMQADDVLPLEELILRVCHSENRYVRLHAVRSLTALGPTSGTWCLIKALSDTDAEVRREAIRAIGTLRISVAVMPLIYVYRKSDFYTRDMIQKALAKIDTPLARKFLRYIGAQMRAEELTG